MPLRRILVLLAAACLVSSGMALSSTADEQTPAELRSRRILELEASVNAAHERLADLLSEAPEPGAPALHNRPELLEIAAELAILNDELKNLRAAVAHDTSAPTTP